MITSFMAGTFWGFALPLSGGTAGLLGLLISAILMILAWAAMALPFEQSILMLGAVLLLSPLVFGFADEGARPGSWRSPAPWSC